VGITKAATAEFEAAKVKKPEIQICPAAMVSAKRGLNVRLNEVTRESSEKNIVAPARCSLFSRGKPWAVVSQAEDEMRTCANPTSSVKP
jgi:hypothetical protein